MAKREPPEGRRLFAERDRVERVGRPESGHSGAAILAQ
jgi:hypothetical protein